MIARGRLGVLFDLDGTLVDSGPTICDATVESLAALGVHIDPRAVRPLLGAPLRELYTAFVDDDDEERIQKFIAGYIAAYDAHANRNPPPLPGVAETLPALARVLELPFAVATTKPTHRAAQQVEAAGLLGFFRHVQGTDDGMVPKPAPDVVLAAAAGLGVAADAAIMVGDTQRDVDAAHAAGARSVVVAWTAEEARRAADWRPDAVVHGYGELLELLTT